MNFLAGDLERGRGVFGGEGRSYRAVDGVTGGVAGLRPRPSSVVAARRCCGLLRPRPFDAEPLLIPAKLKSEVGVLVLLSSLKGHTVLAVSCCWANGI